MTEATEAKRGRGRPRLYDEKCIMVSVRLTPEHRELLRQLSKRTGQSQSRVLAAGLDAILQKLDKLDKSVGI